MRRSAAIAFLSLLFLGLLLGWPGRAGATIVVSTSEGGYDTDVVAYRWSVVRVRAGSEANDVRVTEGARSVTIRDGGETFRVGSSGPDFGGATVSSCVLAGRHAVRCRVMPPSSANDQLSPSVIVDAGGGDDRLFVSTRSAGAAIDVFADLGTGADVGRLGKTGRLSGGPGPDRLRVTRANPFGTTLEGEDGDDVLSGAASASGGPGDGLPRDARDRFSVAGSWQRSRGRTLGK